ncbi:MAG TPA: heavy metal sensor histidine kinase [Tepidisphaeraceae bacterium]|jgi:two-component system heavy metal sensor histidine kinase CusS
MSLTTAPEHPAPRRTWSLALRLTAWYVGSSFVILVAATVFLYVTLEVNLRHAQDQFLIEKVHVIRGLLQGPVSEQWKLTEEVEQTWAPRQYARVYARVLGPRGALIAESPEMTPLVSQKEFPPVAASGDEPSQSVVRSSQSEAFRLMSARGEIGPDGGEAATIQVALDTGPSRQRLAEYRRTLLLVLGIGLAGCALAGYWLARAGLRPLRQIAGKVQRIRSNNLAERIDTFRLPAELADLGANFNSMLERLQDSFDRLQRFSADIAHELRTPVNNMRIEAEVALGKARSLNEYQETLGSCLEECGRLSRIIDSMLFIARSEDPRTHVSKELVDVGNELERVRDFYEAPAGEAGVTLKVTCAQGTHARLDRTLFQRAVGNLVSNAIRYTPSGGRVEINAGRENGELRVEVADTGAGINSDDLPRIFDRFYRADRARSNAGGNVGLGLAIVKSIVSLHGGTIGVQSEVNKGTRMSIRMPVTPHNASGPAALQ